MERDVRQPPGAHGRAGRGGRRARGRGAAPGRAAAVLSAPAQGRRHDGVPRGAHVERAARGAAQLQRARRRAAHARERAPGLRQRRRGRRLRARRAAYASSLAGVTRVRRFRAAEAKRHKLEIVAVERWLDAATARLCGRDFFFITVLREPVARIVSHCRFEHIPAATALGWAKRPHFPRDGLIQSGTGVVDNFYTRSLLGKDVYATLAPGAVTRQHAVEAMGVLARFDAVLILEDLDRGAGRRFDQLFARLGWCKPEAAELRQTFGPGDRSITFDAGQRAALSALNAPDVGLYHFARDLARALERGAPSTFTPCRPKHQRRGGGYATAQPYADVY